VFPAEWPLNKAAELVRKLQQEDIDVQVVMTKSAPGIQITPLTFAALTGQKVNH